MARLRLLRSAQMEGSRAAAVAAPVATQSAPASALLPVSSAPQQRVREVASAERVEPPGLLVARGRLVAGQRPRVVALAARKRLPELAAFAVEAPARAASEGARALQLWVAKSTVARAAAEAERRSQSGVARQAA